MMKRRGFERKTVGQVSYYYHPGSNNKNMDGTEHNIHFNDTSSSFEEEPTEKPIIFIHGIGVGLIYYIPLIDRLLELGRPLFLPEIPYVTGFHTWLGPSSVLSPGAVSSTITVMIASHGFLKGCFVGHSYGTSWLSYMCKYSPNAVDNVIFLDPICFSLHMSFLTKQFVYHKPDPGSVSNFVRTDVIINWTIQRGFPWTRISLFLEDIPPGSKCFVLLSEKDALIPVDNVEKYLREKGCVTMCESTDSFEEQFRKSMDSDDILGASYTFRDVGHGDWVANSRMLDMIAFVAEIT